MDQLLAELANGQGINGVVDRFATNISMAPVGYVHGLELAANLLGKQPPTQHMDHQFKALSAGHQLAPWAAQYTSLLPLLLSMPGTVSTLISLVTAYFTGGGRGSALKKPGNVLQAHALSAADLDGGALFNTKFDI